MATHCYTVREYTRPAVGWRGNGQCWFEDATRWFSVSSMQPSSFSIFTINKADLTIAEGVWPRTPASWATGCSIYGDDFIGIGEHSVRSLVLRLDKNTWAKLAEHRVTANFGLISHCEGIDQYVYGCEGPPNYDIVKIDPYSWVMLARRFLAGGAGVGGGTMPLVQNLHGQLFVFFRNAANTHHYWAKLNNTTLAIEHYFALAVAQADMVSTGSGGRRIDHDGTYVYLLAEPSVGTDYVIIIKLNLSDLSFVKAVQLNIDNPAWINATGFDLVVTTSDEEIVTLNKTDLSIVSAVRMTSWPHTSSMNPLFYLSGDEIVLLSSDGTNPVALSFKLSEIPYCTTNIGADWYTMAGVLVAGADLPLVPGGPALTSAVVPFAPAVVATNNIAIDTYPNLAIASASCCVTVGTFDYSKAYALSREEL